MRSSLILLLLFRTKKCPGTKFKLNFWRLKGVKNNSKRSKGSCPSTNHQLTLLPPLPTTSHSSLLTIVAVTMLLRGTHEEGAGKAFLVVLIQFVKFVAKFATLLLFATIILKRNSTISPVVLALKQEPVVALPLPWLPLLRNLRDNSWYLDSGASNHLTPDLNNLTLKETYTCTDQIMVENGCQLPIHYIGSSFIPLDVQRLILNGLLHVLEISKNLISISR